MFERICVYRSLLGFVMEKNLIFLIQVVYLFFAFNGFAEHQTSDCKCQDALRGYNRMYRKAWIGCGSGKDQSDPYCLMSASIKAKMILDPSNYFEYYHNLHVFNESLINYLNYKINDHETYPAVFGKNILMQLDRVISRLLKQMTKLIYM